MNKQKFESGVWHHEAVTWRLVYCGPERQHQRLKREIRERERSTAK